jgi:L,D-peptidoglycan transpeptidase YkuD (ErfK/YbiS/YcfS/YnhG family)
MAGLVPVWQAYAVRGLQRATATFPALVISGVLAVTIAVCAGAGVPASGATSPPRELITVTAASHSATYATLRAYRVSEGKRVLVFGPWTARVGYNGIAPAGAKREGDGRTPSGTYGFSFFFGVRADHGFRYAYRHASAADYWDDDPSSPRYNEWVDVHKHNAGRDPEPLHVVPAYNYAAVITYNATRTPGLGSAIFLHVGTGGPTLGCVSLPQHELIRILRWLRPADHPQITITAK